MIVDHSTEEKSDPESWTHNIMAKEKLFKALPDILGQSNMQQRRHFVPIKITGLASPHLLERMTEIIEKKFTDVHQDTYQHTEDIFSSLLSAELDLFQRSFDNLSKVCELGIKAGVGVLLDAEESNRQPAIDLIAMMLMEKHNKSFPHVYNTFQMYLR